MKKPEITIMNETSADVDAITTVTMAAFEGVAISNKTEQHIIQALRTAGALSISLVAKAGDTVIGHIAFSPVTISDGTSGWFGLGPLSVLPEHQQKGIGKALIREGFSRLRDMHAQGCCLVGHPEYYRQFGFANTSALTIAGVPSEVFFVLPFGTHVPRGAVSFHGAYFAKGNTES